ncbi:MAG: DEAD/DEAH box helicase [Candidatus Kapabacteria bacterium]|nr:DEAD/DEAH box helicase [Candidatus Kapabacteria bacterium]
MKKRASKILKFKGYDKNDKLIPYHHKPDYMTLDEWQAGLRKQFGIAQNFVIENLSENPVFSDFNIFNPISKKTYKVAIRSDVPGLNFCSCPDFKVNLLGTCKHIEYILHKINGDSKFISIFKNGNIQYYSSISLKYGSERKVYLRIGENNHDKIKELATEYFDSDYFLKNDAYDKFEEFQKQICSLDNEFRCYYDAVDYIIEVRGRNKRAKFIENKFNNGISSAELDNLINAKLYPYQKEGILFAAKSGRCLIADDMGLGKTIQAIAATEIFANEFSAEKVLIVCPTSLKYQWKAEIEKFTNRSVCVIEGMMNKRWEQYKSNDFYKITSYNSIKNDLSAINNLSPDLVILDEAQRIKNWKTKTAQSVKSINCEFAMVLTGTPLENRLDELHSLVEFVDRYKLGALFRFLSKHQTLDDNGKVIGYHDLHEISKTLDSILIRRKKEDVLLQLPERIDKNYFVTATEQQMDIHNDYADMVAKLVHKWQRNKFLSEPDRKKLLVGLSCMRMVCDSTYILDQTTRFDTKIDELMVLIEDIFEHKDEKVVIFSQWERMTRLVAKELEKINVKFEYLHGGIASAKRKDLLSNFANDIDVKVFLSTDAGGVGLNLQTANVVINLDIPWNPAVLEQRIARVHRLGQGKHVRVINFITKDSIEERILHLLSFKQSVFDGVLDNGEDQVFMEDSKFKKIMSVVEDLSEPAFEKKEFSEDEITEIETYGEVEKVIIEKVEEVVTEVVQEAVIEEKIPEEMILTEHEPELVAGTAQSDGPNIQELFVSGIDFLQKLSKTFSNTNSTKEIVKSFIQKDEKTGKTSLNIPIPDEKIVEKAVDVLDAFLKMLRG